MTSPGRDALIMALKDAVEAMEWAFHHLDRGDGVLAVTDTLENIERAEAQRRLVLWVMERVLGKDGAA